MKSGKLGKTDISVSMAPLGAMFLGTKQDRDASFALLELYRARAVAFDQSEPLGVLQVSWTGDRPNNEHLATEDAVEVEDADD